MSDLCADEQLQALLQTQRVSPQDYLAQVLTLAAEFPNDARLQFMLGSALIGEGRLIEGHRSLTLAVALAPDFAVARFQLGLFQLTSGEVADALETWARLDRLPNNHYLRRFVDGLRCLIRDEFDAAITHLRAGISLNTENPPMNGDMQLIIEKCRDADVAPARDGEEPQTETTLMLQRFNPRERPN